MQITCSAMNISWNINWLVLLHINEWWCNCAGDLCLWIHYDSNCPCIFPNISWVTIFAWPADELCTSLQSIVRMGGTCWMIQVPEALVLKFSFKMWSCVWGSLQKRSGRLWWGGWKLEELDARADVEPKLCLSRKFWDSPQYDISLRSAQDTEVIIWR